MSVSKLTSEILHVPRFDCFAAAGNELVVSKTSGDLLRASMISSSTRTAINPPLKDDTTHPSAIGLPSGTKAGVVMSS